MQTVYQPAHDHLMQILHLTLRKIRGKIDELEDLGVGSDGVNDIRDFMEAGAWQDVRKMVLLK